MISKVARTKNFFAFSQGLLLVFAWRQEDYSLSLRQTFKDVDYEEINDDIDGCHIRHRSKRTGLQRW